MRALVLILALAACGGGAKQQPVEDDTLPDPGTATPGGGTGTEEPSGGEARTELERRQDAACERVIPRLTACAVADAKARLSPEQYKKEQIDEAAPIHTRENLRKCKEQQLSSRQVRVYEVCDREESECGPLVACLENLKPKS